METEWFVDRVRLFQLRREHPDWTQRQLANELKRSLSWVKKWLRRFREAGVATLAMFQSRSRNRTRQVVDVVRQVILSLRDGLKDIYRRVVGAKTILYHLHRDPLLREKQVYLPRSTQTIWKVLREGGAFQPECVNTSLLSVRNRCSTGRWILVSWAIPSSPCPLLYCFLSSTGERALRAVARLLVINGLPQKLRFDNDTRFVGNWLSDGFPSPLMRFLLCLGIEPDLVEPGKPYHKPFVERSIRMSPNTCHPCSQSIQYDAGGKSHGSQDILPSGDRNSAA